MAAGKKTTDPSKQEDCFGQVKECYDACDIALKAGRRMLDSSDNLLKSCKASNSMLQETNLRQKEKLDAWYTNPWVVGILGLAVGGATSVFLLKK